MNEYKKKVDDLLVKIDDILFSEELVIPSLYMGDLGRVLYFSYRYLQTKDEKYSRIAKELLEELVNNSNNYVLDSSLGNGITGYYWVILHLIDLGILDSSDENVVKDILPYIEDSIKQDFIKEDYDFLYGCMGKITCLLSSKQKLDDVNLNEILSFFREIKKSDNKGVFWLDTDTDKDNQINLGTAHGMPSILLFIIHTFNTKNEILDEFINPAISWLLSRRKEKGISSFSHNSDDINSESRLAWCYGDLGISYLFLIAGIKYKNAEWFKVGVEIAKKASQRDINGSGISFNNVRNFYDTCFCHGTSGVAYIFSIIAKITDIPEIISAKNYWEKINLENFERLINDFLVLPKQDLSREKDPNTYFCQNIGLLEGIIGSALVLIYSTNTKLNGWSELFLLNEL